MSIVGKSRQRHICGPTFSSIFSNLNKEGLLCFDIIDANRFILEIGKGQKLSHKASFESIDYQRDTFWRANLENGMDFYWEASYYKKENEKLVELGKTTEIPRAFTLNEMEIFLQLNGFEILETRDRPSYVFPTYVIIAKKKND